MSARNTKHLAARSLGGAAGVDLIGDDGRFAELRSLIDKNINSATSFVNELTIFLEGTNKENEKYISVHSRKLREIVTFLETVNSDFERFDDEVLVDLQQAQMDRKRLERATVQVQSQEEKIFDLER